MKRSPARRWRTLLLFLLAMDALLVVAVLRLPTRLVLPAGLELTPPGAPGFAAVTPTEALFVLTSRGVGSTSTLVRVPLEPGRAATRQVLGAAMALHEPVQGLDAFMPTGPRFAWNGRTLLLAAPARALGAHRVYVVAVPAAAAASQPTEIDGARPSTGWARDHFEVAYIAPAPAGEAGRVQSIADFDEHGELSHDRIIAPAGTSHGPLAWPGGERREVAGAEPSQVLLPDGTAVEIPRHDRRRDGIYFELGADGNVRHTLVRTAIVQGSEIAGRYVARAELGGLQVDALLGSRVARPRYTVRRAGHAAAFETDREARLADLIAVERAGVIHLIDPTGFHVRLRAADLSPLEGRSSRVRYLAGALGAVPFFALLASMVAAHLLGLLVARAGHTGSGLARVASVAGLSAVLLAGLVVAVVWSLGGDRDGSSEASATIVRDAAHARVMRAEFRGQSWLPRYGARSTTTSRSS